MHPNRIHAGLAASTLTAARRLTSTRALIRARSLTGTLALTVALSFVGIAPGTLAANNAPAPATPATSTPATSTSVTSTPTTSTSAILPDLLISEVESSPDGTPDDSRDWIELHNRGSQPIDISGYTLKDNKDSHSYVFPAGTTLAPGEFVVISEIIDTTPGGHFTFGLGKEDSVRLFDEAGTLVDSVSWTSHAPTTYVRADDGSLVASSTPTPGSANAYVSDTPGTPDPTTPTDPTNPTPENPTTPTTPTPSLVVNEIDSAPADYVELYNAGTQPFNLTNVEIRDNSDDHRFRFTSGTIEPSAFVVVDAQTAGLVYDDATATYVPGIFDSAIGIGSGDSIRLFDASGALIDSYSWTAHAAIEGDEAAATYARCPDGTGPFALATPTLGAPNQCVTPKVAINEIESDGDANDWVEVINIGTSPVDMSGWYVMDNDPVGHASDITPLPAGTVLEPGARFVFEGGKQFGFGLGKNDEVSLFDAAGALVDSHAWTGHATGTYSRIPEGTGAFVDAPATKGTSNTGDSTPTEPTGPTTTPWPGSGEATTIDTAPMFLEDSSGLDYAHGVLWAVDNGTGSVWKLDTSADGDVTPAAGWESPRRVRFAKDAANPQAKGPDTEGITIAGDGNLYLASERDNSAKGVNYNAILRADPSTPGTGDIVANAEWDITGLLPSVSANMGIEAIEWVSFDDIAGKLWDSTTNAPLTAASYPDAVAGGVFFVALEDNGHVYALILSEDGSARVIADIDSQIGGAMALNYDRLTGKLWIASDNGYAGVIAQADFTGTADVEVAHLARPAGLPDVNHEGFALSDECGAGTRMAWFFEDGVAQGALKAVALPCEVPGEVPGSGEPGADEPGAGESGAGEPTDSDTPDTGASGGSSPSGTTTGGPSFGSTTSGTRTSALAFTGSESLAFGVGALLLLGVGGMLATRRRACQEA
ncbi:lamin tail domain-containing protein [Arcanobacterium haemolyticum]|nr:lamin tail domain-containing protein [Arcanobacterium haemolyticum]